MSAVDDNAPDHSPDPLGRYIGQRLQMRRRALGLSQQDLAGGLNLPVPQIDAYEQGARRIPSKILYQLSALIDVPVSFFFGADDDEQTPDAMAAKAVMPEVVTAEVVPPLAAIDPQEAVDLLKHFLAIRRLNVRQAISALVAAIAQSESTDPLPAGK